MPLSDLRITIRDLIYSFPKEAAVITFIFALVTVAGVQVTKNAAGVGGGGMNVELEKDNFTSIPEYEIDGPAGVIINDPEVGALIEQLLSRLCKLNRCKM